MNRRTMFKKLAGFALLVPLIGKLESWKVIKMGGAVSLNDPHGKFCESKEGWNSFNPADYQGEWSRSCISTEPERLKAYAKTIAEI